MTPELPPPSHRRCSRPGKRIADSHGRRFRSVVSLHAFPARWGRSSQRQTLWDGLPSGPALRQHSGDDAPFGAGRGSSPRSTGRLPASARKETPPQNQVGHLLPHPAAARIVHSVAIKQESWRVGNVPPASSHQLGSAGKISSTVSKERGRPNLVPRKSVRKFGLGAGVGCKHCPL